jgi:hypothetical protein
MGQPALTLQGEFAIRVLAGTSIEQVEQPHGPPPRIVSGMEGV